MSGHFGAEGSACEGKTLDDLLLSFLRWSQKKPDLVFDSYNVSKAFRRLKKFAEFQDKYHDEYFSDPVLPTEPGFSASEEVMPILVPSWTTPEGLVTWYFDLPAKNREQSADEFHAVHFPTLNP